jgi:hypothetical protein
MIQSRCADRDDASVVKAQHARNPTLIQRGRHGTYSMKQFLPRAAWQKSSCIQTGFFSMN